MEKNDKKSADAGYQPKKATVEPESIKGYQPKKKPPEGELNPPSGGSNVSESGSKGGDSE